MPQCENPEYEHEAIEVHAYVVELEYEQKHGGVLVVKKRFEMCEDCCRGWTAEYAAPRPAKR
jgi:hypothetical protein